MTRNPSVSSLYHQYILMKKEKFSLFKQLKSFNHAFNGLKILVKEEHNSWIHIVFMLIAITLGFILNISIPEWIGIILSIGLVISLELINSAIENLADFGTKEINPLIKKTKDLAAAGVFFSALSALIIGSIVFIPKLIKLL